MVDGTYKLQATRGMSAQEVTILASTLNVDLTVHSQPIAWYYASMLHDESCK
jgi:hypothetical protein